MVLHVLSTTQISICHFARPQEMGSGHCQLSTEITICITVSAGDLPDCVRPETRRYHEVQTRTPLLLWRRYRTEGITHSPGGCPLWVSPRYHQHAAELGQSLARALRGAQARAEDSCQRHWLHQRTGALLGACLARRLQLPGDHAAQLVQQHEVSMWHMHPLPYSRGSKGNSFCILFLLKGSLIYISL